MVGDLEPNRTSQSNSVHGLIRTESGQLVASPQTSFGVRLSRIQKNECVTNEPQRTSAGRLVNWNIIELKKCSQGRFSHIRLVNFIAVQKTVFL